MLVDPSERNAVCAGNTSFSHGSNDSSWAVAGNQIQPAISTGFSHGAAAQPTSGQTDRNTLSGKLAAERQGLRLNSQHLARLNNFDASIAAGMSGMRSSKALLAPQSTTTPSFRLARFCWN